MQEIEEDANTTKYEQVEIKESIRIFNERKPSVECS